MEEEDDSVKKTNAFYLELGFLSTKFATAEQLLGDILSYHISKEDNDLIADTIVEEMSLYKRMQYLIKIVRIRSDWEKETKEITDRLDKVRTERNLFIHGVWTPVLEDEEVKMTIITRKIKYSEYDSTTRKSKKGGDLKMWTRNGFSTYSILEIQNISQELDEIITLQRGLLAKIEIKGFE